MSTPSTAAAAPKQDPTSVDSMGTAEKKPSYLPANNAPMQKAIVKNADMSEAMQQAAVDVAKEALNKFTVEKDVAAHVKKTMDAKYGPTWHAVVGKNYGSYVTHETNHFIYFYLGQTAFLLWKA